MGSARERELDGTLLVPDEPGREGDLLSRDACGRNDDPVGAVALRQCALAQLRDGDFGERQRYSGLALYLSRDDGFLLRGSPSGEKGERTERHEQSQQPTTHNASECLELAVQMRDTRRAVERYGCKTSCARGIAIACQVRQTTERQRCARTLVIMSPPTPGTPNPRISGTAGARCSVTRGNTSRTAPHCERQLSGGSTGRQRYRDEVAQPRDERVRRRDGWDAVSANELVEPAAVGAAHGEPGAVLQNRDVLTVEPWLELAHAFDVHDGGAVNAQEHIRREPLLHIPHAFAQRMHLAAGVQLHVVGIGFHPVDVGDANEEQPAVGTDGESFARMAPVGQLLEYVDETLIEDGRIDVRATLPHAFDGVMQSFPAERFKEIVHRVHV